MHDNFSLPRFFVYMCKRGSYIVGKCESIFFSTMTKFIFYNRSTNRSIKLLTQNNARRHVYPHFCRGLLLAKNDDDIHEGGTGSNLRDHESRATRLTNVICQKCLQIIWVVVGALSLLLSITTIYYYHYWSRIMCN